MNGDRRWPDMLDMDQEQADYFDEDDDEEDVENLGPLFSDPTKQIKIMNGSPSPPATTTKVPMRPLVSYGDYDEDEEDEAATPVTEKAEETVAPPPPKRRRDKEDDDEEDELGKIARGKRRSPAGSGVGVAGGVGSPVLGRKRSFGLLGSPGISGSPMKKIAISIGKKGEAGEASSTEVGNEGVEDGEAVTATMETAVVVSETGAIEVAEPVAVKDDQPQEPAKEVETTEVQCAEQSAVQSAVQPEEQPEAQLKDVHSATTVPAAEPETPTDDGSKDSGSTDPAPDPAPKTEEVPPPADVSSTDDKVEPEATDDS